MTLKRMIEEKAKTHADKAAIICEGRRISYSELNQKANCIAHGLTKLGVQTGDRAAMVMSDSPEFAITYFGTVKVGAVAVPINTAYSPEVMDSTLWDSKPKVLVAASNFLGLLVPSLPQWPFIQKIIQVGGKTTQFISFQEILDSNPSTDLPGAPGADLPAHIIYTSGTTGKPKGAVASQGGVCAGAFLVAKACVQTEADVVPIFGIPMFHAGALAQLLITTLSVGGTSIIIPEKNVKELIEAISRERGSILMGLPWVYDAMASMPEDELKKYDLSSLRLCITGGAPMPATVIKGFKQLFGLDIISLYASTEASAIVAMQPLDGSGKLGSVGKVTEGWKLCIVDNDGKPLPPSQIGEICIQGPSMIEGYFGNPHATREALRGGWFYSADIGQLDEEGNLYVMGRKQDTIVVAGQQFYAGDIEDVLYSFPGALDAAVVGVPDPDMGEIVKAVLVPKEGIKPTEEEVVRFCQGKLPSNAIPRKVEFRDSMPRTASGKIQRYQLK